MWDGNNENLNGLIRQYFPKRMVFDTISDEKIKVAENWLKHHPRKRLGFKIPNQVFYKLDLHLDIECKNWYRNSNTSFYVSYV